MFTDKQAIIGLEEVSRGLFPNGLLQLIGGVVLLSLLAGLAHAQPTHREVERWGVVELAYEHDQPVADPFAVVFGAAFVHADGHRLEVPGFYNGGGEWLVRFSPPVAGQWLWTTYSGEPALAGQGGTLAVSPPTTPALRGPIRVSPENPRKFVYADGSPYFLMAFELDWLFALDAENDQDIPRTRQLVNQVAEHGFNQIVMNVFAYDAGWGEKDKIPDRYNFAQPTVFPFAGTNESPDHSTLNVEYFQRLDRVIEYLGEQGIVAHLMIYVWNKKVNWPPPSSIEDNRYFDYVVKRYQAYPHLVWDISKEALGYGHDDMGYITGRIDRLRSIDAHRRLVSVHDYDYCEAFPEKVDFISIQEWEPYLYDRMLQVAAQHDSKPVFNIEHGGYERTTYSIFNGAYTDPIACLDRVYQCVFAGTYATYYWQNTAWYNVIYDPFSLPQPQQPHFDFYQNLTTLFDTYDFNTLRPLQNPFAPPILTDGQSVYLFYLPRDRGGLYGTIRSLKGKTVRIRWFNPITGEFIDGGEKDFVKGGWTGIPRPEELTSPIAIAILEVIQPAADEP